jgi:peptidyl-prolyl cis-trans isomerase C
MKAGSAPMRTFLREPLVHFVALGALVFALDRMVDRDDDDPRAIVVTPEIRARLAAGPPEADGDALERRIETWIDEEMLYREAIRLGLDRDDPMIRRRLVQKMEFVHRSGEPIADPTDAELEAFLAEHAERYAGAPRYDFVQLVVPRASDPEGDTARDMLAQLKAGTAAQSLGRLSTSRRFSLDDVAGTFGPELAVALPTLAAGTWSLVELPTSWALVRVDGVERGATPPLSRVRNRVALDWKDARARSGVRAELERLRGEYRVQVQP